MILKRISALFIAILLFVALVGCNADNVPNDNNNDNNNDEVINVEPAYGGELVVPITYINTLNPLLNGDKSLFYFNKLIYEGLFEFNKNHEIVNKLAESYKISEDGRSIDIKLKDNVYWHDGERFTAEDIEFTINVLKYGARELAYTELLTNVYKPAKPTDLEHILNIKIIDDFNLEIQYDRTYSNALESLIFPVIPMHQFKNQNKTLKQMYEDVLVTNDSFEPIGTGPYKFMKYNKLKSVELEANNNWWNGRPYIKNITGKILEDSDLSLTSYESGETDLAIVLGVDWEKYRESGNTNIFEFTTQNYEFIGFNFENELFAGEEGKAIRKAVSYAIDIESIIEKVYLKHAMQTYLPISPNSWLVQIDEANKYYYSPEKATDILNEAGWNDKDEDGVLENGNGEELRFTLLTNSNNDARKKTANIIIQNLNEIGIKVNFHDDIDKEWDDIKNIIYERNFDMALLGWELSYIPDLAFAFHSNEIDNGTNFIAYRNDKMDELIVEAFRANNRQQKKEVYNELNKLIIDELPYISLYMKNSACLIDKKVMGDIEPLSFDIYNNIHKWYIPEVYQ